jgi:hypothetical protein
MIDDGPMARPPKSASEGAKVPVEVSDEELAVIDVGLDEARHARRIDARVFLRKLRLDP